MANTIQDLMVQIGGDAGGLTDALGTVDKVLKNFGASFNGLMGSLSFAAIISSAISAGQEFQDASNQIQRATGATGDALAGMQQDFKDLYTSSTQTTQAIAGALSQISQKTGATGQLLETLTKSELDFAKVTGAEVSGAVDQTQKLFAQWGVTTEQQSVALDVLYVATQKSGISAAQLNGAMLTMGPTLRNVNFGFEDSVALIASFEKAGLDASDMTMGLNQAFAKFKDSAQDPKQALNDLIDKMSTAKTRAEAMADAMDAGFKAKVAGRFVDAVKSGAFNLDEMKKALDKATGSVADMASKTTTMSAEWTKFGREFTAAIEPMGAAILKYLTGPLSQFNKDVKEFGLGTTIMRGMGGVSFMERMFGVSIGHKAEAMGPPASAPVTPQGVGNAPGAGGGGTPETPDVFAPIVSSGWATMIEQYKLSQQAIEAVVKATAEFNNATGAALIPVEYLAMNTAVATEHLKTFRETLDIPPAQSIDVLTSIAGQSTYVGKEIDKMTASMNKAAQSALDASPYGQLAEAFKTLHLSVNEVSGELENNLVAAFGVVANADGSTTSQIQAAWGAASAAVNKMAKSDLPGAVAAYKTYIDALERTGAAMGDIYTAQEKLLQLEIQEKQNRGQATSAEIIQLTNLQIKMQSMATLSAGMGTIYQGLTADFGKAFDTLGNGIVKTITDAKNFGQIWHDVLKSIETMILQTVIGGFMKMAAAWLSTLIFGKAATATANAAQVTGEAAVGGAAAFASVMAAIPFPFNVALAPEVAAGVFASIEGAFLPLALASQGADLGNESPITMLHPYEMVLPANLANAVRSMAAQPTAASSTGAGDIHNDFSGATFGAGLTESMVDNMMNQVFRKARLAGMRPVHA